MLEYAARQDSLRHVTRHLLGLYHGMPRARRWRQMLSDSQALKKNDPELLLEALDEVESEESRIGA
jgi:tRNA-dihydrouridine synthase A